MYEWSIMFTSRSVLNIAVFLVSVILVFYLVSLISLNDLISVMNSINPVYILSAFLFYVLASLFRAVRFSALLNRKVRIIDMFSIVLVHNLANQILPARSGEISYVYLLKKLKKIRTGTGITTLVISRFFDFVAISVFLLISLFGLNSVSTIMFNSMLILLFLLLLLLFCLLLLLVFGDSVLLLIRYVFGKMGMLKFSIVRYFLRKFSETLDAFKKIDVKRKSYSVIGITSAIWTCMFVCNFFLIKGFGIELGIFQIMSLVLIIVILPLLPVYGMGGFGTTEAAITAMFISFGMSTNTAIPVSFGLHIFGLSFSIILGFFGILRLSLQREFFKIFQR